MLQSGTNPDDRGVRGGVNHMRYEEHTEKYAADVWQEYSIEELGQWAALLYKRSKMRTDKDARRKDLSDALNYAEMIRETITKELEN